MVKCGKGSNKNIAVSDESLPLFFERPGPYGNDEIHRSLNEDKRDDGHSIWSAFKAVGGFVEVSLL